MGMSINDYQDFARAHAKYEDGIFYSAISMFEHAAKIADEIIPVSENENGKITDEKKVIIINELGDVFWYLANVAADLGVSLEIIAQSNLDKINSIEAKARIQEAKNNEN